MGTELKTPENCENNLRNRKQKNTQNENSEKSPKDKLKQKDTAEQQNKDEIAKTESKSSMGSIEKQQQIPEKNILPNEAVNFIIKIEFDPMSIALLILALATRFFRLSEPKNVV